MDVTKGATPAI